MSPHTLQTSLVWISLWSKGWFRASAISAFISSIGITRVHGHMWYEQWCGCNPGLCACSVSTFQLLSHLPFSPSWPPHNEQPLLQAPSAVACWFSSSPKQWVLLNPGINLCCIVCVPYFVTVRKKLVKEGHLGLGKQRKHGGLNEMSPTVSVFWTLWSPKYLITIGH